MISKEKLNENLGGALEFAMFEEYSPELRKRIETAVKAEVRKVLPMATPVVTHNREVLCVNLQGDEIAEWAIKIEIRRRSLDLDSR